MKGYHPRISALSGLAMAASFTDFVSLRFYKCDWIGLNTNMTMILNNCTVILCFSRRLQKPDGGRLLVHDILQPSIE
jgi:hypothetical protein